MANLFKKAERHQLRLRMAIDGPSGAGKTATAMRMAQTLSANKRIAVIDTESGSASKYIGQDFGEGPIEFDVLELKSFSPSNYSAAINEAGRLGYEVIVIDSLSHAWEGKDGALELVNKAGGNSYTAWKDVTPMHQAMIQAILNSPAHVIATMRSKTDYVLEADKNGKMVPRKVGMAPVQRAGMEYEFDVYLAMDWSHIGQVTKSRCSAVDGLSVVKPGAEFMSPIIQWLTTGTPKAADDLSTAIAARISDEQLGKIVGLIGELMLTTAKVEKTLPQKFGCQRLAELDYAQADQLYISLLYQKKQAAERAAAIAGNAAPAPAEGQEAAVAKQPETGPIASQETAAPPTADDIPFVPDLPALTQQVNELEWLRQGIPVPAEAWSQALAKRGVTDVRKLTGAQANELILKLRSKVAPAGIEEKAKRTRRTKAEIEAAKAAEQTPAASQTSATPLPQQQALFTPTAPAETEPSNASVAGKATNDQVLEMIRYRDLLGISLVQWSAILAKKNVVSESQLSVADAGTFLANLEKKHQQKTLSAGMAEWGNKVAPGSPQAAETCQSGN